MIKKQTAHHSPKWFFSKFWGVKKAEFFMCWMKIGREIIFQSWLLCDCFYTEMSPTLPLCIGEFFIIGHNPFRVTWAVLPWSIALLSWLSVGSNIIHIRVRFSSAGLTICIRIKFCQRICVWPPQWHFHNWTVWAQSSSKNTNWIGTQCLGFKGPESQAK